MTDYIIKDDRTEEEKEKTIGFWVAKDKFLSGWGEAPGRSLVACPVVSYPDMYEVGKRFNSRGEFIYIKWIEENTYTPKLKPGDHLHIYNTKKSFRYPLKDEG